MRHVCFATLLLAAPVAAFGQEFKMEPGPKTPAESLACIKTRPGFKVELMVAEPLVMDPIAFAWGPDGKLWVVEMGDYPLGVPLTPDPSPAKGRGEKGKPGGKIKYLEKSRLDGPYDKMTVFMDGLGFPTGVFPYGKGILVTCAPDIFYAEDTKGTGKADKKEILFTGFKEGNQQHRVNGLVWGIDNWIYGANGDSGGVIKSMKTGKEVDIRGRDFRFKVETGEFEAQTGQSQFGRCRDDWGNWFGNNNSNPMFHYVLEDHYLKRNPHVFYPDPRVQVSVKPGASQVFPISKPLPRFNSPQALNHFTSACSTIIYRDTLFGKEFEGNAFISEPVHNLIHREIMKPKGVTFTSQRADDEQQSEFLASSDNWFRPTMIQVGPDGALWIADMYRYVIEHPEWIPKDWQKKLDLRAGHDLGRIYRVYPEKAKPREIPRMDKMASVNLATHLESPSGWVRDMAQQLLVQRFSADDIGLAKKELVRIATSSKSPEARLHAFYSSEHLDLPNFTLFEAMLRDPHPAIAKHAVDLAWWYPLHRSAASLSRLSSDAEPHVRMRVAYVAGGWPETAGTLGGILSEKDQDQYIVAAAMSAITRENYHGVTQVVAKSKNLPDHYVAQLVKLEKKLAVPAKTGFPKDKPVQLVKEFSFKSKATALKSIQNVAAWLDYLDAIDMTPGGYLDRPDRQEILKSLAMSNRDARSMAADEKLASADRLTAIRTLNRGLGDDKGDCTLLALVLTPQTPDEVQSAAIKQLGRSDEPHAAQMLMRAWKGLTPPLRGQALDVMLSRALWTDLALIAIKTKQIDASEIGAIHRQRFLQHAKAEIRGSAEAIFAASVNKDRATVVSIYWLKMPEKGDASHGAKLYAKACASCHKLGEIGVNVGPDLASVGDKSPQGLLTAILDPNRAVETRYIQYVATTKKGIVVNGILSSETSTSITLTASDGTQHQLLRRDIEDLASTGKSLMPEGLEKDLSPKDIADIIEFIRGSLPSLKRKQFPGNEPKTMTPAKDGRLHLMPSSAAIYGPSIVIEKKYGNLGYWSKPDDHAVWTVELAKETNFSVWLDFACAPESAGNTLVIQCGREKISYKVQSTASWDVYQLQSIGQLRIPAGRHEIAVRPLGEVRNALIDLKQLELRPR